MTGRDGDSGPRPWPGDAAARRLLAAVRRACDEGEDLPGRLEAGLGAALDLFARDPELARLLAVQPYLGGDEEAFDAQQKWIARFGGLLSDAAAEDPRATAEPSFVAPFLIDGARFQIARLVLSGEGSDLLRLLPGMLEAMLAYYYEPGEPRRLARPAPGAGGSSTGNGGGRG
ncbi:MAG TPA: hypothetical protein VHE08_04725 [Solirubrobacterales bacterium]|nr:hypothetical protein [Solirubrobacterales bacterium]